MSDYEPPKRLLNSIPSLGVHFSKHKVIYFYVNEKNLGGEKYLLFSLEAEADMPKVSNYQLRVIAGRIVFSVALND